MITGGGAIVQEITLSRMQPKWQKKEGIHVMMCTVLTVIIIIFTVFIFLLVVIDVKREGPSPSTLPTLVLLFLIAAGSKVKRLKLKMCGS